MIRPSRPTEFPPSPSEPIGIRSTCGLGQKSDRSGFVILGAIFANLMAWAPRPSGD